jgi:hypothetical protein
LGVIFVIETSLVDGGVVPVGVDMPTVGGIDTLIVGGIRFEIGEEGGASDVVVPMTGWQAAVAHKMHAPRMIIFKRRSSCFKCLGDMAHTPDNARSSQKPGSIT